MAENENVVSVDRDYMDIYSIKDLAVNEIMPKYFPEEKPSNLVVGTTGLVTEYLGTIAEDSFNTSSSLITEAFPTRARMANSIYSNAAIFQLNNTFCDACMCEFLLGIPEVDIQNNLVAKEGSRYSYFYIDKDTIVNVKGIPFTLDYDIEIRAMYRETQKGWVYSAKYLMDEYKNSVSLLNDPYIKLRKTPSDIIVLQVTMRQYIRRVKEEAVIDNASVNYPTITFGFSGKLAGFDVLYKSPTDNQYTQLEKRVIYSLPIKTPFCYFRRLDESTVEISFTTRDAYFQPKFNSDITIITYSTMATEGKFDYYKGDEIIVSKGDKYEYENSWLLTAKVMSGSVGGKETLSLEGLRQLTVEGFSTANSITTEHDLQLYFNNYKYRYDNEVMFVKKRNDAVELLFSAFMFIKKEDYIYPTNTLTLDTNIQYFDYKDGGFYCMDPGFLFGYKGIDVYYIPVFYVLCGGEGERYSEEGEYFDKDGNPDPTKNITKAELKRKILGGFVEATDKSYWRLVGNDGSMYYLYLSTGAIAPDVDPITQEELFQKFNSGELTYGVLDAGTKEVDFIIDFAKDAAARKAYIANYYDNYQPLHPDEIFDDYLFNYTFKDYKKDQGIDSRRTIFNTNVESFAESRDFMFTNPFIVSIAKDTGFVSYYQPFISHGSIVDFTNQNDDDAFVQFVTYTLFVDRDIEEEKKYHFKMTLLPSIDLEVSMIDVVYNEAIPDLFTLYEGSKPSLANFKKELLIANRLRVLLTFTDNGIDIGYMELIPTDITKLNQFVFEGVIYTDDFITTANTLRSTHICPHCGHEILNSANYNIEGLNYYCDNCNQTFKEGIINIRQQDTLLIPIQELIVRATVIFKDPENDDAPTTNNPFYQYDKEQYKDYVWTNEFTTYTDPITLLEPLQMMRSSIMYKDYFVTGVDALDCTITDMPFMKYSILAFKNEGMEVTDPLLSDDVGKFQYFMNAFLNNYGVLKEAKIRMNGMNIDTKFYNTYGRSTNFDIGEKGEKIDTNNISIAFDIYLYEGTDPITADQELRVFIKDYIESINEEGTNELYVSNLTTEVENNFQYVHYMKFKGINKYDTTYQAIINKAIDFKLLTKEERRHFVPDLLVVNKHNIYLDIYKEGNELTGKQKKGIIMY